MEALSGFNSNTKVKNLEGLLMESSFSQNTTRARRYARWGEQMVSMRIFAGAAYAVKIWGSHLEAILCFDPNTKVVEDFEGLLMDSSFAQKTIKTVRYSHQGEHILS